MARLCVCVSVFAKTEGHLVWVEVCEVHLSVQPNRQNCLMQHNMPRNRRHSLHVMLEISINILWEILKKYLYNNKKKKNRAWDNYWFTYTVRSHCEANLTLASQVGQSLGTRVEPTGCDVYYWGSLIRQQFSSEFLHKRWAWEQDVFVEFSSHGIITDTSAL